MVPKKLFVAVAVGAVLAVGLVVALQGSTKTSSRPLIVAGVSQWGALAHQLVGPDATVVSLLTDPNADPHDHEATTSDAVNVSRASIVLLNGAGYDTWLSQLVSARSRPVATIDVGTFMNVKVGHNPHIFYNPTAASRFVTTLTTMLEERGGYRGIGARSSALLSQLTALQHRVQEIRSACVNVPVAATEDVATYLLSDAGLRIVTPEALRLAIGNGVDPSVGDLALALAQLKQHPAFLVDNIQTATALTNEMATVAMSAHVPVIRVTETMRGTNYVTWLDGVISKIEVALKSEGCLK